MAMEWYYEIMTESLERQELGIEEQRNYCFETYKATNISGPPITEEGILNCPAIFDEFLCWPPTPANTTAIQQCPSFITGFLEQYNASKYCDEDGQWFYNNETQRYWTDYFQCYSPDSKICVDHPTVEPIVKQYVSIINIISKTGYTISFCALIIAFIIMLSFKKLHCPRNKLHMHLFASFILKIFCTIYIQTVLFWNGVGLKQNIKYDDGDPCFIVDEQTNNWPCKLITSLWEFFIIANHSWILMEGLYLHNLIFRALFADSDRNILKYIILGWVLPMLVIIPWVITRAIYEDKLCWTTHDIPFIFLIIRIPIMTSSLINFVLFIRITMVIYSKLKAPIYEEAQRYRKWAKSTLVLVPLFGIHYFIFMGMSFAMDQNTTIELIWLGCDQFFASFQGLFVAILYCFINAEVKTELRPHIHSFLTAWATHEYLRCLFPCRSKYLRSDRGRPSVCTTMSCSSLYNNGIGVHRNSRSKWDIAPKKHLSALDRSKTHVCRSHVRSWHEVPSRWFRSKDELPKAEQSFYSNGDIANEKSLRIIVSNEKSKSEPHYINETSCMLPENTEI